MQQRLFPSCLMCLSLLLLIAMHSRANEPLSIGTQTGDWLIKRYQPTINSLTNHGWDHSNSVILHGLDKVYSNTGNQDYLHYIRAYADDYINEDGTIEGLRTTMDGLHPGVLCLFLFEQTGERKYLVAAENMRDFFLGTEAQPSPFHTTPDGAYWHKNNDKYRNVASVDGLYMAYPFLVRLSVLTQDKSLQDLATRQILLIAERSFNIKYKLPYHAWSYDKSKAWAHPVTGTSTQFWSRASGWFAMALVDVLEYLPQDHQHYFVIAGLYESLADGLRATQHPENGYWYQVLDATQEQDNYAESSATGMIVYSLAKGVRLGLLHRDLRATAERGWEAVRQSIGVWQDGGPQIQGFAPGMGAQANYENYVAIRPVTVPSTQGKQHAHGYMAVLLAASEMEQNARR